MRNASQASEIAQDGKVQPDGPPRRSDSPASMASRERQPEPRVNTSAAVVGDRRGSKDVQRPPSNARGDSQRMEDSPQPAPSSDLRGAFTVSDLERGARRLRGEEPDAPAGQTAAGAGRDGHFKRKKDKDPATNASGAGHFLLRSPRKALGPLLHRTSSADDAYNSVEKPGRGDNRHDASQPASGTTTPARAQSMHVPEEGVDWADEERDQFDTNAAPGHTGQPPASRRNSAFPFPPPQGGAGSSARNAPSESGTATPRNDRDLASISEDEGIAGAQGGGGGLGKKRPAGGTGGRRGSAWTAVRSKLMNEGKAGRKKKEKQGASLTGHELVAVRPRFMHLRSGSSPH